MKYKDDKNYTSSSILSDIYCKKEQRAIQNRETLNWEMNTLKANSKSNRNSFLNKGKFLYSIIILIEFLFYQYYVHNKTEGKAQDS